MTRWAIWGTVAVVGGAALCWQGLRMRRDSDPVLARVGRGAVTQKDLATVAEYTFKDSAMAKQFLTGEANKARRAQAVESVATSRAILQFGRDQGLEKDPKFRLVAEQVQAQAVFQALVERRTAKLEPTEADLKAFYDEVLAEQKAMGHTNGLPEFDLVKAQLPSAWKQRQTQKQADALLKEIKAAVPISFSEGYKPAEPEAPKAAPSQAAPSPAAPSQAAPAQPAAPAPKK